MPFTIFITTPDLGPSGVERLKAANCRLIYLEKDADQGRMLAILRTEPIDGVIVRTVTFDAACIDACPSLKVISRHGAGWNTVDVDAATRRGIPLLIAAGGNANSVAELAVGLMLSAARTIAGHDRAIRAGIWQSSNGRQLAGRTLGLVGLGAVGRAVARTATALGMRVLALDAFVSPGLVPPSVTMVNSLHALLPQADVLSLHCPLTDETRGMIGRDQLAALPAGAIVINTARGPLIDELALIEALRSGHLWGAGLDTFAKEPIVAGNPLTELPNIVMTPHVGGSTDMAIEAVAAISAENALAVLRGDRVDPAICINPHVLHKQKETP